MPGVCILREVVGEEHQQRRKIYHLPLRVSSARSLAFILKQEESWECVAQLSFREVASARLGFCGFDLGILAPRNDGRFVGFAVAIIGRSTSSR